MALTRITKGVIKPNENYDTHNINSTGIVTAVGANFTGNVSVGGVLTYEDVTSIDSVGIITAQKDIHVGAGVSVVGIVTAATGDFFNLDVDGHTELDNVNITGVTTITSAAPELHLTDTNANSDYSLVVNGGSFRLRDETNGVNRLTLNSSGVLHAMTPTVVLGESTFGSSSITKVYSGLGSTKKNALMVLNPSASVTGRGAGVAVGAMGAGDDYIGTLYAQRSATGDNRGTTTLEGKDDIVIKTNAATSTKTVITAGADGNVAISNDLDVDGHTNLDNVSVAGVTTMSGNVNMGGGNLIFGDSGGDSDDKLVFGAGSDFKIFHNGSNNYIDVAGDGHLYIRPKANFYIQDYTNGEVWVDGTLNGSTRLYYNGAERVATTNGGVQVSGTFAELIFNASNGAGNQYKFRASGTNSKGFELVDNTLNQRAYLYHNSTYLGGVHHFHTDGTLRLAVEQGHIRVKQDNSRLQIGAGNDLTLYHDSTNSFIENITGQLSINNSGGNISIRATDSNGDFILRVGGSTSSENAIVAVHHGEVILSCNGATKLTTTTTGITVTGNINATGGQLTLENGNEEQIHRFWTNNTDSDINGLLQLYQSSSTFGTVVEGSPNGHHVIALRDNDNADSFAIVSGGGNYMTDTTYDKIIARFKSDGKIIFGGNTSSENVTLEILPGGTAGNYSQLVIGRTSSEPVVRTTGAVKGGVPISGIAGILFGTDNIHIPAIGFHTPNTNGGHIVFKPKGTEKLRIESDGTIIMGDSGSITGSGVLHLYQASNDPYILIQRGVGDSAVDLGGLYFKNNTNSQAMIKAYQANVNTANLHFYVNYNGNFADRYLMESTGTFAIQGNISDEKIVLSNTSNPYIRFREGSTNRAYVQWNSSDNALGLYNQEDGSVLRIKDGIDFSKDGSTFYNVHHSNNSSDWGENYTNYFVGTSGASTSVRDTEKTRFYKVTISGTRNYAGGNDVRIMRAGVHTDNGIHGMWVGSMDVQIKFRPSNCGNGANYSRVVHNYHSNTSSVTQGQGGGNIAKVRDYISCHESGSLYVWLRGQLSYQITVNGRPANIASIDMNDYVTSMDSSVVPAGFDGEGRDALSIYFGHQGQSGAGRKLYGTSGGVEAQGNVSATGSKPFKIPHPLVGLSTTKNLVHAAIEGPQCDNIYRGKTTLVAGISTVNIDTNAGMSEGTFATLNRDIQCFTTNETGWTNIKGSVSGNKLTIIAQDNSCTDTISWMVVGERQDDNIINNTMTDSEGHLIVEPDFEQIEEPDNPGEFSPNTSQIDEYGVDQTFVQPLSS